MREENILPSEDGKDKEESPGKHEEHQNRKDDGEEKRKGGMDVLQAHHRDIPEQKDKKEEDQTGENQEPDKDSLLGFNLQKPLLLYCGMRLPAGRQGLQNAERKNKIIFRNPKSEIY